MNRYVEVEFQGRPHDPAVEAAVHWCVAKLAARIDLQTASVTITSSGRRRAAVSALLLLRSGASISADASDPDAYTAIASVFARLERTRPVPAARVAA